MGCRVREYEMSLSLDGRLPSGRRAALLRHIAECDTCSDVWESMKQGQDLALSLPGFHVSGSFRQGLQRRIESGEGAPDAVYRDPVPGRTKVRYVLSGAAAAAVVIVALRLFASDPVAPVPSNAYHNAIAKTAIAPIDSGPPSRLMAPPTNDLQLASLNEFNELQLARTTADLTAQSAQQLRARMVTMAGRPLRAETWHEYEEVLGNYKAAVGVLRWMDSKSLLTLPEPLQNEIIEADGFMEKIFHAPSWETRDTALHDLQKVQLERVRDRFSFSIHCCLPSEDLFRELGELVISMPEAANVFRVVDLRESNQTSEVHLGTKRGLFFLKIERQSRPK